jgi:UDP-GlcNAc3NAcA epimerase
MKKIIAVIGARPQFIKHYPLEKELKQKCEIITVHTGQHYDEDMSKIFFDQLGMDKPKYMLDVGSGAHGKQTAGMMIALEEIVQEEKPTAVIVYGDTNSTMAMALVAAKCHIPIIHVEAGLRSYNKEMPEEINRVFTDYVSSLLLCPSENAVINIRNEKITGKAVCCGDIMKDVVSQFKDSDVLIEDRYMAEKYYYTTIHRPYNTDKKERLIEILNSLNSLACKVVFTLHPRTRGNLKKFGVELTDYPNIAFIKPQGYFTNLSNLFHAEGLLTDSGGMQKEAYWLKKKCVTIRPETEWIETLKGGWNTLLFDDLTSIREVLHTKSTSYDSSLYGTGSVANAINTILRDEDFI